MSDPRNNASSGIIAKWKTALLHLSIQYNFRNLTGYLINLGCNLNSQDEMGKTPLLKATYKLQSQTVKFLLTENADLMLSDSRGKNPLQTVLEFPSISECRPIIKSFTSKIMDTCANNDQIIKLLSELNCPLSQIIYFKDANLTRMMLIRGYKVNQRNPSDGNTALHVAVILLDLENVKVLLQSGAGRNIKNHEGNMPFYSIFTRNKSEQKCVDVSMEILNLVMPQNVDWTKCDKDGKLELYPIFVNSSIKFLRIFLKIYNVDLNVRDANGKTVLHYLVESDKTEEYEILKTVLIDVNVPDNHGRTPLHIAAMRGNANAVKFLLDYGADTNVTYNRQTPIFLVFGQKATMSRKRSIALLLQNATKEQLTSYGKTIYFTIFKRFEDDEESIAFSKSVTAHFAMLEKCSRPSLTFDSTVPFYVSSLERLERYYRRAWRKRMPMLMTCYWMYKDELAEMQKEIVYGSVSLFDILTDDNDGKKISRYAWKLERVEELWEKFYKEKYAFYYKIRLTIRFDNAKKLARWRNELSGIFSDTGLFTFDHVVVEKVVRLLKYEDLRMFG